MVDQERARYPRIDGLIGRVEEVRERFSIPDSDASQMASR